MSACVRPALLVRRAARGARIGLALSAATLVVAACSDSSDDGTEAVSTTVAALAAMTAPEVTAAPGTTAEPTSSTEATEDGSTETSATEPAVGEPGLFDFNEDGEKERTCGRADFGAGLVVRTYCEDLAGYANDPDRDATLVQGALFAIPGPPDDPRDPPITDGASVSDQHLQAGDGGELALYTLTSDTVFATGATELLGPATDSLTSIARGLLLSYPTASFEVRGHTDSTGDAAANQALSEQRAATVAAFLVAAGLPQGKVSSVGLGQTVPNYVEDTEAGRNQNRRIEILVRL